MQPSAYFHEYLSDCTNKCYVFYAEAYQIDLNTTVTADTGGADNNDYADSYEDGICDRRDDSVNNYDSIILSGLSQLKYNEQGAFLDDN